MWEKTVQKRPLPPRLEIQPMIRRIAFASVPHLPRGLQLEWLASRISSDTGEPVSARTIKRWWHADEYDNGSVDSRHMDWARAKDRQYGVANDNAPGRAGGYHPCSAEAVRLVA